MSVTVEDLMRLPSLRQAKVIGGSGGMRRVVSSISVLESTKPEILVNELFPDARSGYSGGELVITGFINCTDDVEMQCENVRRLIEGGEVGLVLYYVGVLPAGLFMLITGALMSIVTGRSDISAILASLGVPFIGLVALVLATWTTNVTNAYSGGLALSNLLGFDEGRFKVTTGIAGGIGTLLAAFGLLNVFESFLSLMSALIPALAGVLIASYWVVGAGRRENFHVRSGFSWTGIVSYVVGALAACITGGTFAGFPALIRVMPFLNVPFFVGPVNGIVISLVLYVIIAKLVPSGETSQAV